MTRLVMTAVLTLPLFFSRCAFSAELKKAVTVAVAFFLYLLGAMAGGFLEYNSVYLGSRSLHYLALIVYILAFVSSLRAQAASQRTAARCRLPICSPEKEGTYF